ncbi:MAG: TAXI family TRAP transporter solute-binding subunit [Alphaproteobacteria bacterium]
MKLITPVAAGLAVVLTAGAAQAQTVGIGSTKGSMVAAMTVAISKLVSAKSILKMRRQIMGGTQKYIPVVDAGELEFGLSNIVQYTMAKEGRELSKRKYNNLQLVSTLMRFRTGLLVRTDSPIRTIEDLRGKRWASGFKGAPLFKTYFSAFLANAGMSWGDVKSIPAVGLRQHWNMFKQGKVDVAMAGVGGGPNKDMNAKIPSGVRYISFNTTGANAAAAVKDLKGGAYEKVGKRKAYVAIREPAVLFGYDFTLFTHKNVSVDAVYKVTKAMHDSVKDLHEISGVWRSFNAKRMSKDQGLAYHPGAVKFYKEKGLWKR